MKTTRNLDGFVIDIIVVMFKLTTRMDGLLLWMMSILMEYENGRTELSVGESTSSDNGKGFNLMVVNTTNMDRAMGRGPDDMDIIASNTSIGASIDEGRSLGARMVLRDRVM